MEEEKVYAKALEVVAGKDKIVLTDVKIFETQTEGFSVENADNHEYGTIHSVPDDYQNHYHIGEVVVVRRRTVTEKLVVQGETYSFIQVLDILCKLK